MLDLHLLRQLDLPAPLRPLSAASGLVRHGRRIYVVADDELQLGLFDLDDASPGRLVQLLEGELPAAHAPRKAAKPDLESLLWWPASAEQDLGSLVALGSGSTVNRQRAVRLRVDAQGLPAGAPQVLDLAALFAPLRTEFEDLNIEGAFVTGEHLCLLQRGHRRAAINACIRYERAAMDRWWAGAGPLPQPLAFQRFELGAVGGVPLGFTDGAALPGGGWVFCAAAEATDDPVVDGRCAGSAVGVVGADGRLRAMQALGGAHKTEGIAVGVDPDGALEILLVTDADDREVPASLFTVRWRLPG